MIDGVYTSRDFRDEVIQHFRDEETLRPLRQAVREAKEYGARLNAIRRLYEAHAELGQNPTEDPYSLELHEFFTPIEWRLWQDIRGAGRVHMVPQYPVGPYFLDFACPARKVGIEADGKDFHDRERDRKRDQRLFDDFGWKVYRVTGAETYLVRPSPGEWAQEYWDTHGLRPDREEVEPAAREFFLTTSEGVVRALRTHEFNDGDERWWDLKAAALAAHRLARFPIGA